MNEIFTILTDIEIIFFDLLLYTMLFTLKRDTKIMRTVMYAGCALIISAYFAAVYIMKFPASVSSALCMSIPSFFLFFLLSKYKGSRFILTFCFVDTVSLIIAFIGRYVGILFRYGSAVAFFVVALLFLAFILIGRRFIRDFHDLIELVPVGWRSMAAATILIYFGMIFFAVYPEPMVQRVEYGVSWLIFAAVVVACYVVFIQSIFKTKRIVEQKECLENEKRLYQIAFTDVLTGLGNRYSYIEKINVLERGGDLTGICCIMFDCNGLKQINDTKGHHVGDDVLCAVADALRSAFPEDTQHVFRIGGDEFAALISDASEKDIICRLRLLDQYLREAGKRLQLPLTIASGHMFVEEGRTIENTLILADQKMYRHKNAMTDNAEI